MLPCEFYFQMGYAEPLGIFPEERCVIDAKHKTAWPFKSANNKSMRKMPEIRTIKHVTLTVPMEAHGLRGRDEVLAGLDHGLAPVTREEPISSMDVLRGVALMGILLMNINGFALPDWASIAALVTIVPGFSGPHVQANTVLWFARTVLVAGQMRGIFSMLFGAGIILLTERAERRGGGGEIADIFLRRNMWLVVFGFLHAYLIFFGDILRWYGVTALLFLYPCRKLAPRALLAAGIVVLIARAMLSFSDLRQELGLSKRAVHASAASRVGQVLTIHQIADQKVWADAQAKWQPSQEKVADDLKTLNAGYLSRLAYLAPKIAKSHQSYYPLGFCDALDMMLIGMALAKAFSKPRCRLSSMRRSP
jgi:uncharacterized protein